MTKFAHQILFIDEKFAHMYMYMYLVIKEKKKKNIRFFLGKYF